MNRKAKSEFYCTVGFRLRQMRTLHKRTQAFIAEHLGVSSQTVQRYEQGEIPISTENIAKCAKLLNTSVGFFYGEDGGPPYAANINRMGLMAASEIMDLPSDDIRKSLVHLVRAINRYDDDIQNNTE